MTTLVGTELVYLYPVAATGQPSGYSEPVSMNDVKTFTGGGFTNPMTTGGDIIYGGASGVPTRLANGSAGQVLTSNGTTLAPSWQAGGGGITIGTTTITSGTTTRLLYDAAGVVGEITGATSNGTFLTLTTPVLGVAAGTSLALGGATIGGNTLAITGVSLFEGAVTLGSASTTNVTISQNWYSSWNTGFFQGAATSQLGWVASGLTGTPDLAISRLGAASLRQGKNPSATPVAQTFTLGEAYATGGTNDQAGASGTLRLGGLGVGTGTVAPGIIQVGVLGSSGNSAQTYGTAITINNTTSTGIQFNGYASAGLVSTDGSGNLSTASARAMKEQFRDFQYGLDTIRKITPQWWHWRKETGLDTKLEYAGFIADDVEGLIPELSGLGDPTRAVLAACVNAIRELSERIH